MARVRTLINDELSNWSVPELGGLVVLASNFLDIKDIISDKNISEALYNDSLTFTATHYLTMDTPAGNVNIKTNDDFHDAMTNGAIEISKRYALLVGG